MSHVFLCSRHSTRTVMEFAIFNPPVVISFEIKFTYSPWQSENPSGDKSFFRQFKKLYWGWTYIFFSVRVNTKRSLNVELMLGQRCIRWTNKKLAWAAHLPPVDGIAYREDVAVESAKTGKRWKNNLAEKRLPAPLGLLMVASQSYQLHTEQCGHRF